MTVQDANYGLWIIGIISAAALLASAIIAFMEFFVSITGNAGRHTAGLSFPMGYVSPSNPQVEADNIYMLASAVQPKSKLLFSLACHLLTHHMHMYKVRVVTHMQFRPLQALCWSAVSGRQQRPLLPRTAHSCNAEALCRIILVGILICYIVAAAIELEKWSSNNLGTSYRVWPSWGWICAIVAGVLWWFVGSLAACKSLFPLPLLVQPSHAQHSVLVQPSRCGVDALLWLCSFAPHPSKSAL